MGEAAPGGGQDTPGYLTPPRGQAARGGGKINCYSGVLALSLLRPLLCLPQCFFLFYVFH